MGTGRRELLKAFGATIALHAASPLPPGVLGDQYCINRALGLAFKQPHGWICHALKELPRLRDEQVLEDSAVSALLLSGADPYVLMSRPLPGSPDALAPSMTVFAEEFEFEGDESLAAVPGMVASVLKAALQEYELVGQGEVFSVSGNPRLEHSSRFDFATREFSAPCRHRSLVGVRAGANFTFNLLDYPGRDVEAAADFDQIVASVPTPEP